MDADDEKRKPKEETPAAVRITGGAHDNLFVDTEIRGVNTAFDLDGAGPGNRVIRARHYPSNQSVPAPETRKPKGKATALIPELPWKRKKDP